MQAVNRTTSSSHQETNEDPRFNYWKNHFHLTTEQLRAALASVGNNYKLLEGFLRKNKGLHGH